MLQILSDPKHVAAQTSVQARFAISLALGAFFGRVYHLVEAGPASLLSQLLLLAMAVAAVSLGTDELRRFEDDETKPLIATIAQCIGFIQAALGAALLVVPAVAQQLQ